MEPSTLRSLSLPRARSFSRVEKDPLREIFLSAPTVARMLKRDSDLPPGINEGEELHTSARGERLLGYEA